MCSPHEVSLSDMPLLRSLIGRGRRPNMLVVCCRYGCPASVRMGSRRVGAARSASVSLPGPLELPASGRGTLFLHDIAALTAAAANHAVRLAEHRWEAGAGGVDDRVADAAACRDRPIPRRPVLPAEHHFDRRGERVDSHRQRRVVTSLSPIASNASQEARQIGRTQDRIVTTVAQRRIRCRHHLPETRIHGAAGMERKR